MEDIALSQSENISEPESEKEEPVSNQVHDEVMEENQYSRRFSGAQKAQMATFEEKNGPQHYDNAFEDLGLLGIGVEIHSIAARLTRILVRSGNGGADFDQEKLIDIFKDLGVYATLGMICAKDENFTGK